MLRYICISVFAFFLQTVARSQQGHPIHIQSENGQEFTAHINGNAALSSDGYLVIPGPTAGNNLIVLSFPGTDLPDYAFSCTVADAPLSYSLKWGIDNTWSLFDMVGFTVLHGNKATDEQILAATQKPGDVKPVATQHTAPIATAPKTIPSTIRKIFDRATPGGKDQVYIVVNGPKTDTVAIFIPDIEPARSSQTGKLVDKRQDDQGRSVATDKAEAILARSNKLLP